MSLEKLSAKNIVHEAGMSGRPEYYSGRGAILTDLTSIQLKKIHDLINRGHDNKAAKNFIEMVANMKDLAASNFLTCLYQLEARGWKYDGFQSDLAGGIAVAKDKYGNYSVTHGMIGIMSFLGSHGIDETEAIRQPFLNDVGYSQKP